MLSSGLPVVVVSLDVTNRLAVDDQSLETRLIGSGTQRDALVGELVKRARAIALEVFGNSELLLHDPGAIAALLWPELFTLQPVAISVDRDLGERRGAVNYRRLDADPARVPCGAVQATVDVAADEVVRRAAHRLVNGRTART